MPPTPPSVFIVMETSSREQIDSLSVFKYLSAYLPIHACGQKSHFSFFTRINLVVRELYTSALVAFNALVVQR